MLLLNPAVLFPAFAALGFFFGMGFFTGSQSAFATFGRFGFSADFRRMHYGEDQVPEFVQTVLLVLPLIAESIAHEDQVALSRETPAKLLQKPRAYRDGQARGGQHIPPQDTLAVDLIDVLSAGARATGVGAVQFGQRDADRGGDFQPRLGH